MSIVEISIHKNIVWRKKNSNPPANSLILKWSSKFFVFLVFLKTCFVHMLCTAYNQIADGNFSQRQETVPLFVLSFRYTTFQDITLGFVFVCFFLKLLEKMKMYSYLPTYGKGNTKFNPLNKRLFLHFFPATLLFLRKSISLSGEYYCFNLLTVTSYKLFFWYTTHASDNHHHQIFM